MQCFTALEKSMHLIGLDSAQKGCSLTNFTLFYITLHVIFWCATYGQTCKCALTITVIELVSS